MSTDPRSPDDFLAEARRIRAGWDQGDKELSDPALADQTLAATRDARRVMGEALGGGVVDVEEMTEREIALLCALAAAADRRGLHSMHDPTRPRPEGIDLHNRRGYCDVCDTRAHRLEEMLAQYGPYVFRARVCVRCRRFAPDSPVDDHADAA